MSKPIALTLTPEQQAILAPLFDVARAAEMYGLPGMVIAQVFPDGLLAGFVKQSDAIRLQDVIGGDRGAQIASGSLSEAVVRVEMRRARTGAV